MQGIPCLSLSASSLVIDDAKKGLENPLILSPDQGCALLTKSAAEAAGQEFESLSKKRHSAEDVSIAEQKLDVQSRPVIIFDDLVSTGGTMLEAVKILKKQGAEPIIAASAPAAMALQSSPPTFIPPSVIIGTYRPVFL